MVSDQGTEEVFRRMPHPAMGLVDRANCLGIRLKTSNYITSRFPRTCQFESPSTRTTSRALLTAPSSRVQTMHTPVSYRVQTTNSHPRDFLPAVKHIHEIIIPVSTKSNPFFDIIIKIKAFRKMSEISLRHGVS